RCGVGIPSAASPTLSGSLRASFGAGGDRFGDRGPRAAAQARVPRVTIAFMARSSSAREAYVALLRGINVGGKNVIPMASLVKTFERLGFSRVQTLLASGNVIFAAPRQDARKLE